MTGAGPGKRELNAARTRDKLIDAAVELYGSRSIDAVSLREIGVAAGQRNPNVLQYHFGDRDGVLQAIVDKHACAISRLREPYIERANKGEWAPGEAAARCLVMPIIEYVEAQADGINYVKIVSQIAAVYQSGAAPSGENWSTSGWVLSFPHRTSTAATNWPGPEISSSCSSNLPTTC